MTPASEAVLRCSTPASEAVLGHPSSARTKHFPGSLSIQRLENILNLASAKRRSEKSNDQPTGGEKAGRGGGEKEGKERTVVQNSQELGPGSDKIFCCLQTKFSYPRLPTKRVATYFLHLYEII